MIEIQSLIDKTKAVQPKFDVDVAERATQQKLWKQTF